MLLLLLLLLFSSVNIINEKKENKTRKAGYVLINKDLELQCFNFIQWEVEIKNICMNTYLHIYILLYIIIFYTYIQLLIYVYINPNIKGY